MAVSVRMNPLLEKELEAAAKRRGMTKSQFIVDAVERAIGRRDPFELLQQVQEEVAPYRVRAADDPGAAAPQSKTTGERVGSALEARHAAQTRDWLDYQAAKTRSAPAAPAAPSAAKGKKRGPGA